MPMQTSMTQGSAGPEGAREALASRGGSGAARFAGEQGKGASQ